MTTENNTEVTDTATPALDISNPELSFTDYQRMRRGEKLPESEKSAPETKSQEQKQASESETEETEELSEESKDESEENSDESDDSEKDQPKKKGGFKRRIDKLNARVADRERELEYWKAQALKEKGQSEKVEAPKVEAKAVAVEGKPDPNDFESHSDYVEALTDWKIEQRASAAKQEAEKSKLQVEQENALKSHRERVKSFSEKVEDFQEVLESVDDVRVSAAVENIILSSDNGPELMYELAKNRAEFERICNLSPLAAAREIGRIESKIASHSSADQKQEPKKITTAPKPIQPVGKSVSASLRKSIDDPELPFHEYERLRREQMRKRR